MIDGEENGSIGDKLEKFLSMSLFETNTFRGGTIINHY